MTAITVTAANSRSNAGLYGWTSGQIADGGKEPSLRGNPGYFSLCIFCAISLFLISATNADAQNQGIVTAATEAKRGRLYCAKPLLDILEEPARLTPSGPITGA